MLKSILNCIKHFKCCYGNCCCKSNEEDRQVLICGQGVFADEFLLKKEVDFVLPLGPLVHTNTSRVQKYSTTPDWKNGSCNPAKALRYLVQDHRTSYHTLQTSEPYLQFEGLTETEYCLQNNQK